MSEPIVIKKSPVIIIKNLITLEFVATLAYFIAGVLQNFNALYQNLNLPLVLPYEIAKFIFIVLAQVVLTTFIFLRWMYESYTIYPERLTIERGVVFKKREDVPLRRPLAVSVSYVPLSRIFKYGSLIITGGGMAKPVVLEHVPNPKTYLRLILEQEYERTNNDNDEMTVPVADLLDKREHDKLEFKATFRWDMNVGQVNKNLEKAAMKTICAFLNSDGGHLVIGVSDKGAIVGMAYDYSSIKRGDADGFENHFTNVFKEIVGPEFRRFVKLDFHDLEDKEVCAVRVWPSASPAFMKSEGEEVFYIRTGNSTTPLQGSQVATYIKSRFRRY